MQPFCDAAVAQSTTVHSNFVLRASKLMSFENRGDRKRYRSTTPMKICGKLYLLFILGLIDTILDPPLFSIVSTLSLFCCKQYLFSGSFRRRFYNPTYVYPVGYLTVYIYLCMYGTRKTHRDAEEEY